MRFMVPSVWGSGREYFTPFGDWKSAHQMKHWSDSCSVMFSVDGSCLAHFMFVERRLALHRLGGVTSRKYDCDQQLEQQPPIADPFYIFHVPIFRLHESTLCSTWFSHRSR